MDRYLELMRCLAQMLPPDDPEGVPDLGWVDSKSKQLRAEGEKLEQQLKGYKNNLIKESIRVCTVIFSSTYLPLNKAVTNLFITSALCVVLMIYGPSLSVALRYCREELLSTLFT